MNLDVFYVIGKPGHLTYEFFNRLSLFSEKQSLLKIPRLFTTNTELLGLDNIFVIDDRDFQLRESLGIYCLTWHKGEHWYGICAEGLQWAHNGYSVVMPGSLSNLNEAIRAFPGLNVVLLHYLDTQKVFEQNPILESDSARLDCVETAHGVCCPFLLSFMKEEGLENACDLLLEFIHYQQNNMLEKAV